MFYKKKFIFSAKLFIYLCIYKAKVYFIVINRLYKFYTYFERNSVYYDFNKN